MTTPQRIQIATDAGQQGESVPEISDELIEWREQTGVRIMFAMKCTHYGSDDFGDHAVCETCFDNTQSIGALVQSQAAHAWEMGRAAERRDWEFTADLATPDEERRPLPNPYLPLPPTTTRAHR